MMPRRIIRAMWARLHEPKSVTALMIAAYTATFITGCVLMLGQPTGITTVVGRGLTIAVGMVLAASSASAAAGCYGGAWLVERPAIIAVVTCWVGMTPVLWVYEPITATLRIIVTLVMVVAVCGAFLARYFNIRWADLDPAD